MVENVVLRITIRLSYSSRFKAIACKTYGIAIGRHEYAARPPDPNRHGGNAPARPAYFRKQRGACGSADLRPVHVRVANNMAIEKLKKLHRHLPPPACVWYFDDAEAQGENRGRTCGCRGISECARISYRARAAVRVRVPPYACPGQPVANFN